jgi:Zn-dependent protease/CBS domain-containing protein
MAIQIGKIAGIPIALDYSLFLIFLLIVWGVGFVSMPATYPGLGELDYLLIGILSAVLLFASILIHELAHSIVAKRNGLKVRRVTLYLLGGVSEMEEEPQNPSLELRMSASGPLTSVALTFFLAALWEFSVSVHASPLVQAPLEYAALVNGVVAAFNLIPAFPMDGGRILRSLLWGRSGDLLRSTKTASSIGRAFAYAMIFVGVFFIFAIDLLTGFWLILIGWFISSGAQSSLQQTRVQEDLRGLKVGDIMTRKVDSVPPDMTLNDLSQQILHLKHNGFPVISDDRLQGCVTADDLRRAKADWATARISQIMTPREKLVTLKEEEPAIKVLESMNTNRIGRVFVTDPDGRLIGIVTRSDILKTVELKENLLGSRPGWSPEGGTISFTAERGMSFVLEQPTTVGLEWKAEFAQDGVQLVREATAMTAEGHEMRQFTFQAKRPGTHTIRLVEGPPASMEEKAQRRVGRTVVYTIVVS